MKAIYNSRILPLEKIGLEIHNRAFCYGDGLFETIVTGPDRINLVPLHAVRLSKACGLLDIEIPFDAKLLAQMLNELQQANHLEGQMRFRVQLWRATGGLYQPEEREAQFLITVSSTNRPFYSRVETLGVSQDSHVNPHRLSFAKTMSAMPYVLAGLERKRSSFNDLVITDSHGHIAECIVSNIFWRQGDTVFTPSLESGCIDGVMRQYLMTEFEKANKAVKEVLSPVRVLAEADSVFLTNASGIQWVAGFDDLAKYADPKALISTLPTLLPLL